MRKHSPFFILLFLSSLILLSLFPGCSGCLPTTPVTVTGTIYGYVAIADDTVKDLTGYSPIPGATVTIVDAEGVTHTVITDEDGYYFFNNISIKINTIINITKDTEGGGKLIFKDIVPLVVLSEEDYDAGIADAASTVTALVVEELVNLGQVQEEIDLDEITSSEGFDELKEDIEQAQEDNQDINTDPIDIQAEEIADNIVNPPTPIPTPDPDPDPTPTPTPDPAPTPTQAATTDLSGLALTGSPANYTFVPATYTYNSVTVANGVASITVTPTGTGSITVNETTVASGSSSEAIDLTAGVEKTITVVATETGKTAKTYTINVTRTNPASPTPTFDPAAGAVAFGTTVTITSSGADAIYYTINGSDPTTASTNQASTALIINSVCTVKALAVKAGSDDSAIESAAYTQAATTDLSGLALTGSPDNYTFASATYTYNGVTVENAVASITVTPTGTGSITVNETTVASGSSSEAIDLTAGVEKTITVVATETGKTAKTYTIKVTRAAAPLAVGDSYGGGKVAYILDEGDTLYDENGDVLYSYDANVQHGLIAAAADQGESAIWGCHGTSISTNTAVGKGKQNTSNIEAGCATDGTAADICANLDLNGCNDWFLPSKWELNKLYINKVAIGDFKVSSYWSSSQEDADFACYQYFGSGSQSFFSKVNTALVRAVRAF